MEELRAGARVAAALFQRFSVLRFNEFENSAPHATVRGDMRALLALEDGRFSRANPLAQPAGALAKFVSTPQ
jgi:hypothetical protein